LLTFSFFLGNVAVVLGKEAFLVFFMVTLNTGVVLEVALGECDLLALLGALGLALSTLIILNASWLSALP
jgi:membrane associated rhomboid family serine protease